MTDLVTRLLTLADDYESVGRRPRVGTIREVAEALSQLVGTIREAAAALEHASGPSPDRRCSEAVLKKVCDERDDLKAKLADANLVAECLEQKKEHYRVRAEKAEAKLAEAEFLRNGLLSLDESAGLLMEQAKNKAVERAEKAEAEAAALREALEWYAEPRSGFRLNQRAIDTLSQPGPGAALLERVRKLEMVARADCFDCIEKDRRLEALEAVVDAARPFNPTDPAFVDDPQSELRATAELTEAFTALDAKKNSGS